VADGDQAERRAGELLAEADIHPGRPPAGNGSTLEPFGIDKHQSVRWQALARLDELLRPDEEHCGGSKSRESTLTPLGIDGSPRVGGSR
jgi:hypothetical protein